MTVGTDLVEGFEAVRKKVSAGQKSCEVFCDFIKSRIACEESYSKGLTKLSNRNIDGSEVGSLHEALSGLRSNLVNRTKQHKILAESLLLDVYQPVHELQKEQSVMSKKLLDEGHLLGKEAINAEERHRKAHVKYEKHYREAASAVTKAMEAGVPYKTLVFQFKKARKLALKKKTASDENADKDKRKSSRTSESLVGWLMPSSQQKISSAQDNAIQALVLAEESRIACLEQWRLRKSIRHSSMAAMKTLLALFQSQEKERVALFKDCLRKITVFESSYLANLQYDIQMLAGLMEAVEEDGCGDIRLLINCDNSRRFSQGDLSASAKAVAAASVVTEAADSTSTGSDGSTATGASNVVSLALDVTSGNVDTPAPPSPSPSSPDVHNHSTDALKFPPIFEPITVPKSAHDELPLASDASVPEEVDWGTGRIRADSDSSFDSADPSAVAVVAAAAGPLPDTSAAATAAAAGTPPPISTSPPGGAGGVGVPMGLSSPVLGRYPTEDSAATLSAPSWLGSGSPAPAGPSNPMHSSEEGSDNGGEGDDAPLSPSNPATNFHLNNSSPPLADAGVDSASSSSTTTTTASSSSSSRFKAFTSKLKVSSSPSSPSTSSGAGDSDAKSVDKSPRIKLSWSQSGAITLSNSSAEKAKGENVGDKEAEGTTEQGGEQTKGTTAAAAAAAAAAAEEESEAALATTSTASPSSKSGKFWKSPFRKRAISAPDTGTLVADAEGGTGGDGGEGLGGGSAAGYAEVHGGVVKPLGRYPTEANVLADKDGNTPSGVADVGGGEDAVDLWVDDDADGAATSGEGPKIAPRGRSISDPNRRSKDRDPGQKKTGAFSTSGGDSSPSSKSPAVPAGKLALGRSISWSRRGSKGQPKSPALGANAEEEAEVTLAAGAGKLGEAEGSYQSL
jgi:hypothetical protein